VIAKPWSLGKTQANVVACVCIVIFILKAATSLVQESSTWDETHYFGLGKYLLTHGQWDVPGSILHPPLSFYLNSLPLLFVATDPKIWQIDPAWAENLEYRGKADVPRGQALLSAPENRDNRMLYAGRMMMVLTGALLAWFVYRWSTALYGPAAGVVAAVLCCFCPNILAHSRLITPDIALTTFSFISLYYFWKISREGRRRDVILGGIFFGFALLSKFTALLLFPVLFVLALVSWLSTRSANFRGLLFFGAIGGLVLAAGYGMNLEPFFAGIGYQLAHAQAGPPVFLFGKYTTTGWWYYFPLAFLIKTPIALLILLVLATVLAVQNGRTNFVNGELFLIVPAAAFSAYFCLSHHPVSLRYILPIYPLIFVFGSGVTGLLLSRRTLAAAFLIVMGWYVTASTIIHPHYLAYFNEFVGGPRNGYKYLVDSNLDWGQDLKGLGTFMRERGIPRINLSYFGTDIPERYGISYYRLPSFVIRTPDPVRQSAPAKEWVAISATNLQGLPFKDRDTYAAFRNRQPFAMIGYSILIYRVEDDISLPGATALPAKTP
jgi:4-amino-4-deoxy-L-arabinose transferase-like glycosyltransferase